MNRLYKNNTSVELTQEILLLRRLHDKGLTSRPDTGLRSSLRSKYASISTSKKYFGPLPELKIAEYQPINIAEYTNNDIFKVYVETEEELYEKRIRQLRKETLDKVFNHENYRVAPPVEKIEKKISSINYEKINNLLNKVIPKPIPKVKQVNNTPENKKIITNKEMVKLTFPGKKNRRSGDNTMSFGGKINK